MISGITARTSGKVESPAVHRADKFVAVDLAEHLQVGLSVRTRAFDDPSVELELLLGEATAIWIELA